MVKGLPGLRKTGLVRELRRAFAGACERGDFRLVEYSIQDNHLHLIVEAESQQALSRGMMAISVRLAQTVNRVFKRTGRVVAGRYPLRLLKTPSEVRDALCYVLLNIRKHFVQRHDKAPPVQVDEASSGGQFDGWRPSPETLRIKAASQEELGVAKPLGWLLRIGWRKRGLIDLASIPG